MALEHGFEVIELRQGGVIVEEVRSSVVFMVGSAPIQLSATPTINEPILITDERSFSQYFGSPYDPRTVGYSLPISYYAMGLNRLPLTIVVNVFDPDASKTAVAGEVFTFDRFGLISLMPRSTLTNVRSSDGSTTYPNTAYTYDANTGVLAIAASGSPISAGDTVLVDYSKPDPSLVNAAAIVGGVNEEYDRTGLSLVETCRSRFGFAPKLILAPYFSHLVSVANAMKRATTSVRAMALIDAPPETTIRQALESRGTESVVPSFNSPEERAIYVYPDHYLTHPGTSESVRVPYSAILAGVIAKVDRELGYHYSPSNKAISGQESLAAYPTFDPENFDTEVNLLNEAGIVTVVQQYGRGLVTWGNRNASYPSNTRPTNFISIRRTCDIVYDSVIQACMQYLDDILTRGFIDAVCETVNEFLNVLIGRQALYLGSVCYFDPARNPVSQLAQGRPIFSLRLMSPPPVEKITFEVFVDAQLIRSVLESSETGVLSTAAGL